VVREGEVGNDGAKRERERERGCVKLTKSQLSPCSNLSLLRLGLRVHLPRRPLMLLRAQEPVRQRGRQRDAFLKWAVERLKLRVYAHVSIGLERTERKLLFLCLGNGVAC
jgi:hypothetical protein